MTDKVPLTEVRYFQEPFDAGFHAAPVEIDPDNPPEEWTYPEASLWLPTKPSRQPVRALAYAYRVRLDVLQMLYVDAHYADASFKIQREHPILEMFENLQAIDPIRCSYENQCGCVMWVGRYPDQVYYTRADAWNTWNTFDYTDLTNLLNSVELDIVLPGAWDRAFDSRLEWWVVRFPEITQENFQEAHDRLHELVRWQYDIYVRTVDLGERYLRKQIAEIKKRGWPVPARTATQSKESSNATPR